MGLLANFELFCFSCFKSCSGDKFVDMSFEFVGTHEILLAKFS